MCFLQCDLTGYWSQQITSECFGVVKSELQSENTSDVSQDLNILISVYHSL